MYFIFENAVLQGKFFVAFGVPNNESKPLLIDMKETDLLYLTRPTAPR
jgi:hypothetical protein